MNGNGNSNCNSGFEDLRRSITDREIFALFYNPFYNPESPLVWRSPAPSKVKSLLSGCPFFLLVKTLLDIVGEEGGIKLTQRGNLPPKYCKAIYNYNHLPDPSIIEGVTKITTEKDLMMVHTARVIAGLAGLTMIHKGKLLLTETAIDLLNEERQFELFKNVFDTYTLEFNWSYNDRYTDLPVGQHGFGFTLMLLKVFGGETREARFYADVFKSAVPNVIELLDEEVFRNDKEYHFMRCYCLRSIERFTHIFGLTKIVREEYLLDSHKSLIRKTKLFDAVVGERGRDKV